MKQSFRYGKKFEVTVCKFDLDAESRDGGRAFAGGGARATRSQCLGAALRRFLPLIAFSLALAACTRSGPSKSTVNPLDRLDTVRLRPSNFLHKTFTVKKYASFPVEVPPHTVIPRIHGTFESFVPRPGDDDLSDDSTDVSFLLMNTAQFAAYSHGQGGGTALYTVESTHSHEVEFVLSPTNDKAEKYYVVFVNLPGGPPVKSVAADFTLSFGY
jgi:hypothetical protein